MVPNLPLVFRPIFRSYIWGGQRLGKMLGKAMPSAGDWAESWELVDRASDQSIVDDGPFEGWSLRQLIESFPEEILGCHSQLSQFPLLLKYLDCNRDLSLQVHPNDAYAAKLTPPDLGKTEAWYVIHAEPGAKIYAGLTPNMTRQELTSLIAEGKTIEAMQVIEAKPGDCYFIPAGTVHALGSGLVVAEIQQASDTTFRLFDWNRLDQDGNPRTLHVTQALEVIDFDQPPVSHCQPTPAEIEGWNQLIDCPYFQLLESHDRPHLHWQNDQRFRILTCTRGNATLTCDGKSWPLIAGSSILLPAMHLPVDIALGDEANLLMACLPKAK